MQLLWIVPVFIVGIVGLVLAISKWSLYPRAALFVTIGVSVLLVTSVCQVATYSFILPRFAATCSHLSLSSVYSLTSFVFALLHQSGILLLVLAAFADRKPAAPPPMR